MKTNIFTGVSSGNKGIFKSCAERAGITLLETLVAMVIFTIVTVSATMVFRNSLYRFGGQSSEKKIYSEASRILGYIEKYLPSAMCNDMDGEMRITFKGEKHRIRFISPFSRGQESDLAKFGIYLDANTWTVKVATVRIDSSKPGFLFPEGFAGAQTLGECIESFELSYFNGSEWLEEWDTDRMAEPRLPQLVKIELKVFSAKKTEGRRSEKTFTRLIGID